MTKRPKRKTVRSVTDYNWSVTDECLHICPPEPPQGRKDWLGALVFCLMFVMFSVALGVIGSNLPNDWVYGFDHNPFANSPHGESR